MNLHAPCPCPHCGVIQNASTGIPNEAEAHPGDFCVCFECAGLNRYDEALLLRAATGSDYAIIAMDLNLTMLLARARAGIMLLQALRKKKCPKP